MSRPAWRSSALSSSDSSLRSILRIGLIGIVAAAMFAAGCGGTGGTEAAGDTETSAVDTETSAGDTETSEGDTGTSGGDTGTSDGDTGTSAGDAGGDSGDEGSDAYLDAESPLATYLGFDINDPDAMVEQQRAVEQKVQECMRAQGFEYEVSTLSNFDVFEDEASMSEAEFAAAHGYGMVDSILDSVPSGSDDAGEEGFVDPNAAMLEAMSDTERAAWETAAWGAPPTEDQINEGEAFFEPEGCFGEASAEVFGDFAVFEQLAPAFEAMGDTFDADPRIVEINGRWTTCMSDAGYNFESPEEAYMSVSDKVDAVMMSMSGPGDEPLDQADAFGAMTAQLEEIRPEEVAVATADVTCQGDDLEELRAIQREYELNFIEENKAILDQATS